MLPLAVDCLPGTRVVRGRYVRIGALKVVKQGDSNPVLNLAEVQAFSPSGTLLKPVKER